MNATIAMNALAGPAPQGRGPATAPSAPAPAEAFAAMLGGAMDEAAAASDPAPGATDAAANGATHLRAGAADDAPAATDPTNAGAAPTTPAAPKAKSTPRAQARPAAAARAAHEAAPSAQTLPFEGKAATTAGAPATADLAADDSATAARIDDATSAAIAPDAPALPRWLVAAMPASATPGHAAVATPLTHSDSAVAGLACAAGEAPIASPTASPRQSPVNAAAPREAKAPTADAKSAALLEPAAASPRPALVEREAGARGLDTHLRPEAAPLHAASSAAPAAPATVAEAPLPTAGALAAASLAATPSRPADTAAPSATPAATVAAPIDSPAFAPAFAAQVRWLAEGEVAQARLALHPVEMGPVTVNIRLDGREAHIDFAADLAATRSAIESSLPALAAALESSGLTLAGGGVFDGAPRQRGGSEALPARGASRSRAAAGDVNDVTSGAASIAAQRPRGLVDLLA